MKWTQELIDAQWQAARPHQAQRDEIDDEIDAEIEAELSAEIDAEIEATSDTTSEDLDDAEQTKPLEPWAERLYADHAAGRVTDEQLDEIEAIFAALEPSEED